MKTIRVDQEVYDIAVEQRDRSGAKSAGDGLRIALFGQPITHVGGPHPEAHSDKCYCGKSATHHIMFGSGCGNVCPEHLESVSAVRRGSRATRLAH